MGDLTRQQICAVLAVSESTIRSLRALLRLALVHVEASAEASHLTDGFKRGPENELDKLAARIRCATQGN